GTSHEQEVSVCYSVMDKNEIFIDERNILHSSWQRQTHEGVVRFIANPDDDHPINPNIKCGSTSNPCDELTSLFQYLSSEPDSIDGSTGRAETIVFGEGKFNLPFIDLSLTRSSIVNIVGCQQEYTELSAKPNVHNLMIQGQLNQNIVLERLCLTISVSAPLVGLIDIKGVNAGLVMQDMKVQGYQEASPYNTMFDIEFIFRIEGFALMKDVIIEHIYLQKGSILQVVGLRRSAEDARMEWLGKTSIGFHDCKFDDITSNETALITLKEKILSTDNSFEINEINHNKKQMQNVDMTTKFIIQGTQFSRCASSLNIVDQQTKGGLIHMNNKKVRLEILNSEFRNIAMKSRNMIYLGWSRKETVQNPINILRIINTILLNCSSAIPEMRILSPPAESLNSKLQNFNFATEENIADVTNELYDDGASIFDNLYRYGLIYIDNQNFKDSQIISTSKIDVMSLFAAGCHCAVGSALSIKGLTLKLTESVFIDPLCYGNIIYLNQTQSTITDCYFKGYNGTYVDFATIPVIDEDDDEEEEEQIDDVTEDIVQEEIINVLCPSNPSFYSSAQHSLVFSSG
ncbi:MAG: hypothetical protein EZS28_041801, partial [Streblomastix strix]